MYRPLNDNVLVKRIETEEITRSGLVIPGTAQERPSEGTVIAVGSGKIIGTALVSLDVAVGDHVAFSKHTGVDCKINGEEHLFLRENEILGVLVK